MTADVLTFDPARVRTDREPQLTETELIAIRRMLTEHQAIKANCPIARKAVKDL